MTYFYYLNCSYWEGRSDYNIVNRYAPNSISDLVTARERESGYNLRGQDKVAVPRFNSYIMKNSLSHRGAILWNAVSRYNSSDLNFNTFYSNVKKDVLVKELNFASTSAQSQPRNRNEFKFN